MEQIFIQLPVIPHMYSLCYTFGFLAVLLIMLYEGKKRGFPLLPWILIITFSRILFIVGTKAFAISGEEWHLMINNLSIIPTTNKFLVGGLILGGIGLFIGKRWMKFRPDLLDTLALALPLGIMIQRIGCLFAGCCYGKSSELPWAIQYPNHSLPYFHQVESGEINITNVCSLPVHPIQVYELLGCLIILFLVWKLQNKWKASGSSLLFSFSLYLTVRFADEFFRAPLAHTNGGNMVGIFNYIQIGCGIALIILVPLLIFRERRIAPARTENNYSMPPMPSILAFFSLSALLLRILSNWFQSIELLAILSVFIIATILVVIYVVKSYPALRIKALYLTLLLIPLILMSQTLPNIANDSDRIRTSKSIGVGLSTGSFTNSTDNGCMNPDVNYFKQKYSLGSLTYNITKENLSKNRISNYGINVVAGNYTETNLTHSSTNSSSIFSVNPYFKYDPRWYGIGVGLQFGSLYYTPTLSNDKTESNRDLTAVYPQFYFRLGPRDIFFIDTHFADQFPTAIPTLRFQTGFGTGFGLKNGTNLRIGTSENGTYAAAYLPIENKFIIEPHILWYSSQREDNNNGKIQFMIGVRYVFEQSIRNKAK